MDNLNTIEEQQVALRESQATEPPSLVGHGERHYSVTEVANLWALSRDSVRRLFRREPGVLAMGDKYVTLRIPESVLDRVHRRLSNADDIQKARS